MEPDLSQPDREQKPSSLLTTKESNSQEIISLEECKQYMAEFQLPDERILEIRNNMIGIVGKVIGAYLKDFEYEDGKRVR